MNLEWNQEPLDFVDSYGLDVQLVEDAVRAPTAVDVDPRSAKVGHPIRRLRRGDIEVIVGYRTEDTPCVLYVRLLSVSSSSSGHGSRQPSGAGAGSGTSSPPTVHELHRRITALGYYIANDSRHAKVYTQAGNLVQTMPRTPSDHRSLANAWAEFKRVHAAETKKASS